MGPPEFTGGNIRWMSASSICNSGFNGAAGIHRRKLTAQAVMMRMRTIALQWGRRNSPAETWLVGLTDDPRPATLQWGRRNSPAETRRVWALTIFQPTRLQWGRRNSPAETQSERRQQPRRQFASMGPPEFTGGNAAMALYRQQVAILLQWGRRNSPAETSRPQARALRSFDASMGPPEFTGGNRRNVFAGCYDLESASMGPPEFTGGNTVKIDVQARRHFYASMGPPEFTGGNGWYTPYPADGRTKLQWGRRNSPAETMGRSEP